MPVLILLGSSGHALVVADAARRSGWTVRGYLDDYKPRGAAVGDVSVLGGFALAAELLQTDPALHYAIGIGDNHARWRVDQGLTAFAARAALLVHPSAVVAATAQLEPGCVVLAGAIVGPGARVARQALINTRASLDHDSLLELAASLAPGAVTGGNVQVGARSAIGLGALIRHRTRVGADCVVGQGANVVKDLPDRVVAYGNPARVVRSREIGEPYL